MQNYLLLIIASSVQFSCSVMSDSLWPHWLQQCKASLSITKSQSLLKLMSIMSVMSFNHLIFCRPLFSHLQSFPASKYFPMSWFFASGGQIIEVSTSASVLPMNIQDWFPLGWTVGSPYSPRDSQESWCPTPSVVSNTTVQKHQFFSSQLSL